VETGTQIGATSVFTLQSGTATDGTWLSERLVLPEFDYHDITVTVTDNDGVSTTANGVLHYLIMLSLADLTYSRTTITYAHRSVTVRGRVLATPPDTGVAAPIRWKVGLAAAVGTAVNVTSLADGRFAGTVTFTGFVDSVIAVADFDGTRPEYYWSGTYDMYPTVKPAPTRLSLQVSRAKVRPGQTVTANGTLTRNLGEGFVPVADAAVAVEWCVSTSSCASIGSVTTDGGGNYATTYAPTATGWFQLTHTPSGPDSQLLGSAAKTSRVITVLPAAGR
jgi:hypothetical protein